MGRDPAEPEDPGGLADETAFVLALGGYALEIAGGALVTHERIGVARFNFVDGPYLPAGRLTAFFERALDHYFQRALRPRVRRLRPVPPPIDRALRQLGFVAEPDPLLRLSVDPGGATVPVGGEVEVVEADPGDDRIAELWTAEGERDELRRALDVLLHHPEDGERLVPLFARIGGGIAGGALLHEQRGRATVQLTSTVPAARGQGVATAIVAAAVRSAAGRGIGSLSMLTENPRLAQRLAPLGFRVDREFTEYRLPPEAQLAVPAPSPTGPPRWRPPRAAGGGSTGGRPGASRRA